MASTVQQAKGAPRRLEWLSGLRALCCIIILCGHLDVIEPNLQGLVQNLLGSRRLLGHAGPNPVLKSITGSVVECFFAMAGYVCVLPFLQKQSADNGGSPAAAAKKSATSLLLRYAQMAVPLAVCQCTVLLLWYYDLAWFNFHRLPNQMELQAAYDEKPGLRKIFVSELNGPIWILEPLMLAPFVVMALFLCSFWLPRGGRTAVLLCGWTYALSEAYLAPMGSAILGAVVALYLYPSFSSSSPPPPSSSASSSSSSSSSSGAAVYLLLPFTVLLLAPWMPITLLQHTYTGHVCSGVSLLIVAHLPVMQRLLAWNRLVRIGPMSFSVYIWHHAVFGVFGYSVAPYFAGLDALLIPCAVAAAFFVSWLSHRFVERPVNARMRKLVQGWMLPVDAAHTHTVATAAAASIINNVDKDSHV
jgi:peptidoglycan/LPS O-acetylase OafA/YrhL